MASSSDRTGGSRGPRSSAPERCSSPERLCRIPRSWSGSSCPSPSLPLQFARPAFSPCRTGAGSGKRPGYARNRPGLDSALAWFQDRERPRVHAIDVDRPVEVIDFVLQDPGGPARDAPAVVLAFLGEPGHLDLAEPRYLRGVPRHAQASLPERDLLRAEVTQHGIDDHAQRKCDPLPGLPLLLV